MASKILSYLDLISILFSHRKLFFFQQMLKICLEKTREFFFFFFFYSARQWGLGRIDMQVTA